MKVIVQDERVFSSVEKTKVEQNCKRPWKTINVYIKQCVHIF